MNTDLLFTNQIAEIVSEFEYSTILTNGTKKILQWRSPNYLYSIENNERIRILFRNENLSSEFSALFTNINIEEKNININKFYSSLDAIPSDEHLINIYLNYNFLGGSQRMIKQYLFQTIISNFITNKSYHICIPSEITQNYGSVSEIGTEEPVCWAEHFHSFYYPGNVLQKDAIRQLSKLKKWAIRTNDTNLQLDWQYLQTSDHFHLMDENHPAFHNSEMNYSIYKSKYEAYINYMNILEDYELRLKADKKTSKKKESKSEIH